MIDQKGSLAAVNDSIISLQLKVIKNDILLQEFSD